MRTPLEYRGSPPGIQGLGRGRCGTTAGWTTSLLMAEIGKSLLKAAMQQLHWWRQFSIGRGGNPDLAGL